MEDWNEKTVVELKAVCTARGLSTSGKKADLVARLEGTPSSLTPTLLATPSKRSTRRRSIVSEPEQAPEAVPPSPAASITSSEPIEEPFVPSSPSPIIPAKEQEFLEPSPTRATSPLSAEESSPLSTILAFASLLPAAYLSIPYAQGLYSSLPALIDVVPAFLLGKAPPTADEKTIDLIALQLAVNFVLSIVAYFAAKKLIPIVSRYNERANLKGIDLNKRGGHLQDKVIPEALGLASGTVFVIFAIFFQLFYASASPSSLVEYNAALLSICFTILLGFADDVLNIPWRYKLILPTVASLPLLVAYTGATAIVIPRPLYSLLGGIRILELGLLYKVYMGLLAVFCTNSINILAGINGLEAGQSFVIACAVLVHNLLEINNGSIASSHHLFSICLISPFIATTLALLHFNWYPSRVFVGDTFTYLAGMTFAVVGILGHFSKTLLLFFIPQILNFLYSVPQLFGFIPCPRHRIPRYNPDTGKMEAIPTNLTLLNLALMMFGPMTERQLCIVMLAFQALCCGVGFFIRYYVSSFFFDA